MNRFTVKGNSIYEGERLVMSINEDGAWLPGPGVEPRTMRDVPPQLRYLASSNVFTELKN